LQSFGCVVVGVNVGERQPIGGPDYITAGHPASAPGSREAAGCHRGGGEPWYGFHHWRDLQRRSLPATGCHGRLLPALRCLRQTERSRLDSSHASPEAAALHLSIIQSDERLGSVRAAATSRLLAGQGSLSRPAAHPQKDQSRTSASPRHGGRLGGQVQWASAPIDPRRLGRSQADGAWPRSANPHHSLRPTVNALCQIGWQSERLHVALDGHRSLCLFADYGFRLRHGRPPPLFRPCIRSIAGALTVVAQDGRGRNPFGPTFRKLCDA
jgi:hypothetical protein